MEALQPLTDDYTLFVHLIPPDGSAPIGADAQRRSGLYATSLWQVGDGVVDNRKIGRGRVVCGGVGGRAIM